MRNSKVSEFNPAEDAIDPDVPFDHEKLLELAAMRMPFGRYQGRRLVDLPERYVIWFAQEGFPPGRLGDMLKTVYEIKANGLEFLFDRLR